jgi:hypothetical protein
VNKQRVLSQYKFYLAFENNIIRDYVSEKVSNCTHVHAHVYTYQYRLSRHEKSRTAPLLANPSQLAQTEFRTAPYAPRPYIHPSTPPTPPPTTTTTTLLQVFDGLLAGSLPVYWGTASVDRYMPGPHAVVKASDFEGPKELAAFLKTLASNETLYQSYFGWKQHKPTAAFRRVLASTAYK